MRIGPITLVPLLRSLRGLLYNWVKATGARYKGKINFLNFANEPLHAGPNGAFARAFGGAGKTGCDWVINIGKLYRKYFPGTQLGINDFGVESVKNTDPSTGATLVQFVAMVKALKAAGVVDWVGLESYSLETVATPDFTGALNQIGACGVNIFLTEFSPYSWEPVPDENARLAQWQRLLIAAQQNRYVVGVTGPWAFRRTDSMGDGWIVDDTVSLAQNTPTMIWLKGYNKSLLSVTQQQRAWRDAYQRWLLTVDPKTHGNQPKVLNWLGSHAFFLFPGGGDAWYAALKAYETSLGAGNINNVGVWVSYVPAHPFPL